MPLRLGASGSVRASSRHQSACIPPLAQSFWPLTTKVSPSLRGRGAQRWPGRSPPPARRSPAPRSRRRGWRAGAVAAARRCPRPAAWRRRGGSRRMPARVGVRRARRAPDRARSARPTDMPPPHSRRPVRHGEARRVQFGEPRLLERDELRRRSTPVCAARQSDGHVRRRTTARTCVAELVEVGRVIARPSPFGAVQPGQAVAAERVGQQVAGRRQPKRQAPQRLAVARQPGQRGLVAEADGAVQLVGDAEDHLGGLQRGHPQGERVVEGLGASGADAPQRVLGEHLQPGAFDLGVGQLELHALERGQRLAELLAHLDVGDGEFHCPVEHSEQRPAGQRQRQRRGRPRRRRRAASSSSCADERGPGGGACRSTRVPRAVQCRLRPSERRRPAIGRRPGGCRRRRAARRRRGRSAGTAARRRGRAVPSSPRCGTARPRPRGSRRRRGVRDPRRRGRRGPVRRGPRAGSGSASARCTRSSPPAASNARRACTPNSLASSLRSMIIAPPAGFATAGCAASRCCPRTPSRPASTASGPRPRGGTTPRAGRLAGDLGRDLHQHLGAVLVEFGDGDAVGRRVGGLHLAARSAARRAGRPAAGRGGSASACAPSGRAVRRAGRSQPSPSASGAMCSSRSQRA